jgi:hypothetical protein
VYNTHEIKEEQISRMNNTLDLYTSTYSRLSTDYLYKKIHILVVINFWKIIITMIYNKESLIIVF